VSDDFFDELNDLTPESAASPGLDSQSGVEAGLSKLASLVEDLNRDLQTGTILDRAMGAAIELTGAERGFLVLVADNGEWKFSVARNMESDIQDAAAAASHTVIRKVLEGQQPILINDVVGASDLTKQQSIAKMQVRSIMGAPLISKGKLLGAAYVDTSRLAGVFDSASLVLFETFVHLAAVALENARLIEAEKESKARYQELQEYLSTILKSQPHGVMIFDMEMLIEYASPQAVRFLGGRVERGISLVETQMGDDAAMEKLTSSLKTFAAGGENRMETFQRGERTYSYSFFHLQGARDGRPRVGMILEDITTQKHLESQLIESEKRSTVNQLAGGIAHEINNSLQPVKGRVELLQMRLEKHGIDIAGGIDKDLTTIASLTERIEKIARNLRHLTKPAKPNFENVDLKRLITATVELLDTTSGSLRGFGRGEKAEPYRLILDIEENLPAVHGDPHGLESAFINLIINSTHAVREKPSGSLTISAKSNGDKVDVSVTDTGVGIHPDALPHVFEPYFTTKGESGTGIGMSIIQNIAAIHGAELDLKSNFGEGTTITMRFPAVKGKSKTANA
jgi:signal transduction histidine kinase